MPTISLRIDPGALDRIDHAAECAGETRTTYILSWVPEYWPEPGHTDQRNTETAATQQCGESR